MFGVVDDTTTTKFVNRACAVTVSYFRSSLKTVSSLNFQQFNHFKHKKMCLCARMLAPEWKGRAFIEKVNSRCFCWFLAAILVDSLWRLYTKLYKGAWNVSANNSETVGNKDLGFGRIIYILVFYNILFSWLLPLNGFQFIFFLCRVYCVTVKTKNKTFAFRQGELLTADCGLGSSSQRG